MVLERYPQPARFGMQPGDVCDRPLRAAVGKYGKADQRPAEGINRNSSDKPELLRIQPLKSLCDGLDASITTFSYGLCSKCADLSELLKSSNYAEF